MLDLLALKGIKPEDLLKCSGHFSEGGERQPDEKVGRLPKQREDSDCRGTHEADNKLGAYCVSE